MTDETEILARIEAFLAASGMKPTVFGKLAVNDRNLVAQLRNENQPRELRRKTRERVELFLAEQTQPLKKIRPTQPLQVSKGLSASSSRSAKSLKRSEREGTRP